MSEQLAAQQNLQAVRRLTNPPATPMPAYHPVFLKDEQVRIHDRGELERFLRPDFKYHHPISNEQLSFAGVKTKVTAVSYYHWS